MVFKEKVARIFLTFKFIKKNVTFLLVLNTNEQKIFSVHNGEKVMKSGNLFMSFIKKLNNFKIFKF